MDQPLAKHFHGQMDDFCGSFCRIPVIIHHHSPLPLNQSLLSLRYYYRWSVTSHDSTQQTVTNHLALFNINMVSHHCYPCWITTIDHNSPLLPLVQHWFTTNSSSNAHNSPSSTSKLPLLYSSNPAIASISPVFPRGRCCFLGGGSWPHSGWWLVMKQPAAIWESHPLEVEASTIFNR